jgi:REP element-mobilizing transposase RayT
MTAENQRQRLRRLELVFVHSPIYFVTACTYNRRKLLANPAVHEAFLDFAERGPAHGSWIGAYVIMPDHLHLFVAMDDEKIGLASWMKSLKNTISKTLRMEGITAPHSQKTFFAHLLGSRESYSEKWSYVRENPVRVGLVKTADDWPFSGEIFPLEYRSG